MGKTCHVSKNVSSLDDLIIVLQKFKKRIVKYHEENETLDKITPIIFRDIDGIENKIVAIHLIENEFSFEICMETEETFISTD